MELEEKLFIYKEIDFAINEIYKQIKLRCEKIDTNMFVNKQVNQPNNFIKSFEYNLELVIRENLNSDDYGVVYSLNIEEGKETIIIAIDITRSFGEVLYSKGYTLQNNQIDSLLENINIAPAKLFDYAKGIIPD